MTSIKIILTETSHPGNIGAVARAMKVMGFEHLRLVNPKRFPDTEAYNLATHAYDILDQAQCFTTLEEALGDCQYIFATSSRARKHPLPVIKPRMLKKMVEENPGHYAIVFGNEQSGLSNEQMQLAQKQIIIPTNPLAPVLNLAQACQIILYELFEVKSTEQSLVKDDSPSMHSDTTYLIKQAQTVLSDLNMNNHQTQRMMTQFINRAQLSQREVNFLNGFFRAIRDKIIP